MISFRKPVQGVTEQRKFEGVTSMQVRGKANADDFTSTSSFGTKIGSNTTVSNTPLNIDLEPLLTGITPQIEQTYFHRLYRDIYFHDPVAGSAADMISSLPFSDFSLGGIPNRKIEIAYMEAVERLNLRTLPQEIALDYLVLGSHTSSILYNENTKKFTDVVAHAVENLNIEPLPFYSQDPIITAKFPAHITAVLNKSSTRIERLKKLVGAKAIEKLLSGELELDPLTTVYIPRKTFSNSSLGTSFFRRILPLYLIEKNLYRGTLIESSRRQRAITHLTLGDGLEWQPTIADMEFATNLFMEADNDPLGAIIATRLGISSEELRSGGDFWKSTDFADSVLAHKTRALGISEGLLSGDANWNTADTSLTVFIDMLRTFRDMLTRKFFYNKMFPLISMANGFVVSPSGKIVVRENLMDGMNTDEALFALNDGSKLLIPTVNWSKQLKPEGDSAHLDMLNGMTEKGIPVPLRVLAAAGGLNLDELLRAQDEDLVIRKNFAEYIKKIKALTPAEEGAAEASAVALAADAVAGSRSSVQCEAGKIPLFSREFGETSVIVDRTKTGKPKYVRDQKRANEKINKALSKAISVADKRGDYKQYSVKPDE